MATTFGDMYDASRGRRACAVDGCNNAARSTYKGIRLCRLHAVKEERTSAVKKTPVVTTPPLEAEARFKPGSQATSSVGPSTPKRTVGLGGESCAAALLGVCPEGMPLSELEEELHKAAKDYLARLPGDYPEKIRSHLQGLAAEGPASPDPVLKLARDALAPGLGRREAS